MSQFESATLDRTEVNQTMQRCAEAYHRVIVEMPKNPNIWTRQEFQEKAFLAFAAHLPVLINPASFQIYIACIAQGAAIGAIDPMDAGRFCHIAQTAMSAWKLANLTVPAAEAKEREAREKLPRAASAVPNPGSKTSSANSPGSACSAASRGENPAAPPSPKGNHPPTLENLYASSKLPSWDVQTAHFSNLRTRGIDIPTDDELRADPAAALHWVETARRYMLAENAPARPPAEAQPQQPTQAA